MLCYDKTKCGVNGPQLAALTQRQRGVITPSVSVSAVRGMAGRSGMGSPLLAVMAVGQAASAAKGVTDQIRGFFSGLFGKNPDKAQFDNVRQNVWNQFATIVNAVDSLKRAGTLTRNQLEDYMRSLQTLIENFNSYYNRVRSEVTPAYGDPRFHDYYDVFIAKYDEWENERLSIPAGFLGGLTGGLSSMDGSQMLMLGALLLAIISGSRRRSNA